MSIKYRDGDREASAGGRSQKTSKVVYRITTSLAPAFSHNMGDID